MITFDEFKLLFDRFRLEALAYIKARAPRRSGRLKTSIHFQQNHDGFSIIIDISYVVYTEERWISPRWRGRENPNLGWIRECVRRLANKFANKVKGVSINVT